MGSHPWSETSWPEEWTTVPAQDVSASMQPSGNDWPIYGAPVTTQDIQALDAATMLSVSHGSVDSGLSPVLSHESQSSYTLNSFSEPEPCVLPPSLDLSFTEPSWNASGPNVYTNLDAASQTTSGYGFPSIDQGVYSTACTMSAPQGPYPGSQPPMFFPHGGQAAYQQRIVSYSPVAPMRPILPRTEGSAMSSQPAYGPHRALRPQVQGQRSMQHPALSVSSSAGRSQDGSQHAITSAEVSGHTVVASQSMQHLPQGFSGANHSVAPFQPSLGSQSRTSMAMPYTSDPTADDFSAFIQFDQEDHSISPGALRSEH